MNFDLSDEQKATREAIDGLLRDRIESPGIIKLLATTELNGDLWNALMDLGLAGILVPATSDGLGLDLLTLSVVAEVLAFHATPSPVIANALTAWLIDAAGTREQRLKWVKPLMSGEVLGAFALHEDGKGWLPEDWTLSGRALSGQKTYVEWGSKAHVFVVGTQGGEFALVDRAAAGLEISELDSLDRSRPLAALKFTNVNAEPLEDFAVGPRIVDALTVLNAADAFGAAFRAYQMAIEYAQNREQFGRIIGSFQAVKHQLANMAIDIEPCRALFWYAAHLWDTNDEKASRAASTAKSHTCDIAVKTARAATEVHGGIGYTWDYPLHVFLKRAMHARLTMGLPSVHRERMAKLARW
jgi:alkylation response protein AidB-like acyl-CoA dehydrogenase